MTLSRMEELKDYLNSYISPDDIIMAILFKMESRVVPKDPSIFHSIVSNLRNKGEYKELLDDFYFDESGLTPFSEELDQVLFRLETSSVLETLNPKYEKYELNKDSKSLEESFNKFSGVTQRLIYQISKEFDTCLNN